MKVSSAKSCRVVWQAGVLPTGQTVPLAPLFPADSVKNVCSVRFPLLMIVQDDFAEEE
jgi:hypothetical protein